MSTKDATANDIAVKYLGRALIALIIGIVICFLASLSYNTYIRFSQKEIEVQATNSNSQNNNIINPLTSMPQAYSPLLTYYLHSILKQKLQKQLQLLEQHMS